MMKKYLTIMLAALMLCAMSFTVAGKAWAADSSNPFGASLSAPTVADPSKKYGGSRGTTDPQTSINSNANKEQTKDSTSGGHTLNWNIGYDKDGGKTFVEKLLSGSGIGGNSGKNHSNAGAYTANAGTLITQSNGGAANVGTVGGGGYGGGIAMPNLSFGGGSGIFSTAINKMLNLFGNVKLLLYVIAAFGLVGFAFMAIFGKVRWGWVCALAFGLAAVAAAGQIIDYVSQSGMGSTMGDTLGANAADF
jgi:hypothetical protein